MGWEDEIFFAGVGDDVLRREKAKARDLRKSRWWQGKISEGRCYYCGTQTLPADLTMDHVVPLTRGGFSSKNNLVACCKGCNTKKKGMLPQEWQDYLEEVAGKNGG